MRKYSKSLSICWKDEMTKCTCNQNWTLVFQNKNIESVVLKSSISAKLQVHIMHFTLEIKLIFYKKYTVHLVLVWQLSYHFNQP